MKKKQVIDRDIFVQSGKKGGATTALRGPNFYRNIGLKGSKIRWDKKKASDEAVSKTEDGIGKTGIV